MTCPPAPGPAAAPVPSSCPSPCVNICRMDERSGLCEGCARTLDEIAVWSLLDETEKRAVWAELAQRRPAVGPAAG